MPYKRRKRRRKTTRRTIRRSPVKTSKSNKPEVKYLTIKQDAQSIRAGEFSPADYSVHGTWTMLNDIIAQIGQGVGPNARIGAKIHVLKITHRYWGSFCPLRIGPAIVVDQSCATLRMIWHTGRVAPGTAITDFFSGAFLNKIYAFPDRRIYGIHRDTVKVYNSGWSVKADGVTSPSPGQGYMLKGQYTMNVNRDILIGVTAANATYCRNDSDVYSLIMFSAIPYSTPNVQYQTICLNSEFRIYYTDD